MGKSRSSLLYRDMFVTPNAAKDCFTVPMESGLLAMTKESLSNSKATSLPSKERAFVRIHD
jgi:hypothetical protein